jgi:type II secretory pathway pseudopilin PulG
MPDRLESAFLWRPLPGGRRRRAGFTLLELLVVVGVIMLLMGLLFPAFSGAKETARKTKAKANVKQLDIAFKAILADRIQGEFTSGDVNTDMVGLLSGGNSRSIAYMEFDMGSTNTTGFADPWGRLYHVALDTTGNGTVSANGETLPRQVAVWSDGPDKQAPSSDDITSWK